LKLVYTHPNIALVTQAQSLIEHEGIECALRNEYASGAVGELAPISAWPEVWVVDDNDFDRAVAIVEASRQDIDEADWRCPGCGSSNPATFESCWHCGGDKP
jgi:hypothetical protein